MDIGELMNFHPNRANKRPFEDFSPSPSHKQPRRSYKYPPTPAHSIRKPVPVSPRAAPVPSPVPSPVSRPVSTHEEAPVEENKGTDATTVEPSNPTPVGIGECRIISNTNNTNIIVHKSYVSLVEFRFIQWCGRIIQLLLYKKIRRPPSLCHTFRLICITERMVCHTLVDPLPPWSVRNV